MTDRKYTRRLIEVDLPIKRISEHARREKSIRHGHISTLHMWWARRPLAACRAVICAALWPDPVDDTCPTEFREAAFRIMKSYAREAMNTRNVRDELLSEDSLGRLIAVNKDDSELSLGKPNALSMLRQLLLDFIADFANWDASTNELYLKTARELTQTAHEALGGEPGTRPLLVDPFAGGGAIPLEALRVGADAFASDLNPVAVLLNKVVLEYIPKYGQKLAHEVSKWGQWVKEEAEKELADFYPKDPDGATPIAYLWARTIKCEGPGCGAEVPLIGNLWVARRRNNPIAYAVKVDQERKRVAVDLSNGAELTAQTGTVKRASVTCPVCGFTTPAHSTRRQIEANRGGAKAARLLAVVTRKGGQGRVYRVPTEDDYLVLHKLTSKYDDLLRRNINSISMLPNEETPTNQRHRSVGSLWIYGMRSWLDLYTKRQAVALAVFASRIRDLPNTMNSHDREFSVAVQTVLALALDKQADLLTSLSKWEPVAQCPRLMFVRHALAMLWDFAEAVPIGDSSGSWTVIVDGITRALGSLGSDWRIGSTQLSSAVSQHLPDDSSDILFTDPPYYDSVAYADLSDFFYVWLKRTVGYSHKQLFAGDLAPKNEEAVVQHPNSSAEQAAYENMMAHALLESKRVTKPDGLGVVVFAHKSTAGWESLLNAVLKAGWCITASWPVDTELAYRVHAQGYAALGSSVHLVCRPRVNSDGTIRRDDVGDWREVLNELPARIHQWMPHLAQEGVVGADAIFACLGPALEIFSRYSSVEKSNGDKVELSEYLEHVWAAVAHEALNMIFQGADASGFEEDARLTAMWLWTLRTAIADGNGEREPPEDEEEAKTKVISGYSLEYDAARKISQGLGAHLERLDHLVEVRGETATLLSAAARTRYLFGRDAAAAPRPRLKKTPQLAFDFTKDLEEAEREAGLWPGDLATNPGTTVLDQLHQSMILFGAGRGEAVKRLLLDEGVGQNPLFWRLAQSLSALYPPSSEEKRWVDGVLGRKKGLGL